MPCTFCELLTTDEAQWIARESIAVAFLQLPDSTLAPGHALVASRRHCVGVLDADEETLTATTRLVKRVGLAMTQGLHGTGIVVLNASSPHPGQSLPHLQFHVVPCWPDDGATLWPADRSHHTLDDDPYQALTEAVARQPPSP